MFFSDKRQVFRLLLKYKKNRKKTVPEPIPASEPVHIPLPEPVPELELSEELSNELLELSLEEEQSFLSDVAISQQISQPFSFSKMQEGVWVLILVSEKALYKY